MEITHFISEHRETLLIASHNDYRQSITRQILATRRRLGRATHKKEKFASKPVTVEDVGKDRAFVELKLLEAERNWAHAMHIKTTRAEEGKGLTGNTRSHIISKLTKAAKSARELSELLKDQTTSKATDQDILEARAYLATLAGGTEFEKQSEGQRSSDSKASEKRWQKCLRDYSEARVIYAGLYEQTKKEVYRAILADTVDPTIRYAAYQAHLSRSIAIDAVAKRYFPKDDAEVVKLVEATDQYAFKEKPQPKTEAETQAAPQSVPNSVSWRGRKANIVDASVGQALAAASAAEAELQSYLSSHSSASAKDKAAAYDGILIASQDAVDATNRSIAELEKERVDEGDSRMQDLRVTSLAVNYDLVSWRVGRNRMLIGDDDGLSFSTQPPRSPKGTRKDGTPYPVKEEGRGHKLARLRERLVLFDSTIQSITSIKDLRGAMRDSSFVNELDSRTAYFRALKCLNVAYSHGLLGQHLEALALLKRAHDLLAAHKAEFAHIAQDKPPTLDVSSAAQEKVSQYVSQLMSRTHALVEMRKLEENSAIAAQKKLVSAAPLVQDLNAYPTPGTQVDVKNLVSYPPKIEPVPVKPLFLDVAWNYIDYPGHAKPSVIQEAAQTVSEKMEGVVNGVKEEVVEQPKKKGWFGFGR